MKTRVYFRFFIMANVGNLNTYLGVTLVYFYNTKVGNLLGMIINLDYYD